MLAMSITSFAVSSLGAGGGAAGAAGGAGCFSVQAASAIAAISAERRIGAAQNSRAAGPRLRRRNLLCQRLLQALRVVERGPGGGLLGLFLRSSRSAPERRAVEPHLHLVGAGVVRAADRQHLVGRHPAVALEELLQR